MRAGGLSWQASRRPAAGIVRRVRRRERGDSLHNLLSPLDSCRAAALMSCDTGRHVAISTGEGWKRAPQLFPVCFKCTNMDQLSYQLYWWSRKQQVIKELQTDLIFEAFISLIFSLLLLKGLQRLYIKDGSSNRDVTLWIWESSRVKHFHLGVLKHARRLEGLPSFTHLPALLPVQVRGSMFTFEPFSDNSSVSMFTIISHKFWMRKNGSALYSVWCSSSASVFYVSFLIAIIFTCHVFISSD